MPATVDYVNERTISNSNSFGGNWVDGLNCQNWFYRRTINSTDTKVYSFSNFYYNELIKLYAGGNKYSNAKQENVRLIKKLFSDEIDLKGMSGELRVLNSFQCIVNDIARLNFNDINVDITKSGNIKFSMLFDENKILMINKSFELENDYNEDNLILYSLFINKRLIATDVCEISTFINGFTKYLAS